MEGLTPVNRPSSAWLVLAFMIAFHISWGITDFISIHFRPELFLPLLVGWAAICIGRRVFFWVLLFGFFSAITLRLYLGPASCTMGFSTESFLMSTLVAIAFARPENSTDPQQWLPPWWRRTLWVGIFLLALTGYLNIRIRFDIDREISLTWEAGMVLLLTVILGSLNWSGISAWLRSIFPPGTRRWEQRISLLVFGIGFVFIIFSHGWFRTSNDVVLYFGLANSWTWLTMISFAATAFGILDWKSLTALLIAVFLASWALTIWGNLPDLLAALPTSAFAGRAEIKWFSGSSPRLALLSAAVSYSLLGQVFRPFWLHRDIKTLRTGSTVILLGIILGIQFMVLPLLSRGQELSADTLLSAAITLLAGIIWGRNALYSGPLAIVLCFLISTFAYKEYLFSRLLAEISNFGALAFPFAFIGVLIHERFSTQDPRKGVLTIRDITSLAGVIRDLDVSATFKAFFTILAPLAVLTNIGKISIFMTRFGETAFEIFDIHGTLPGIVIAFIIFLATVSPLAFILSDWLMRREAGRYISAISGTTMGILLLIALTYSLSIAVIFPLVESEWEPFSAARMLWSSTTCIVLALVIGRITARSQRTRAVLLAVMLLLAALLLGAAIYPNIADMAEHPEDSGDILLSSTASLLFLILAIWFLLRGVRLRLFLSKIQQRSLLLGELRGGFWVRMAFLAGLPSSLWTPAAAKAPSFWFFLISRPLVYLGAAVIAAKTDVLGIPVALSLGVFLVLAGHSCFYLAKILASRKLWRPASTTDNRAPILFLRSFEDDQFDFRRPWWRIWGRWLDLWSFRANVDETLIDEIAQYGPVVALGRPGEGQAPFGAMRHYANFDDWQTIVTDTARQARAIIMVAGDSQGVLWEYELLKREGLLSRTLLLFRSGPDSATLNRRALAAFTNALGKEFDLDDNIENLIALLQSEDGPTLLTASDYPAGAYLAAIRAHFQKDAARLLRNPALQIIPASR